jgi:hypothetical protein
MRHKELRSKNLRLSESLKPNKFENVTPGQLGTWRGEPMAAIGARAQRRLPVASGLGQVVKLRQPAYGRRDGR